MKHTIALSLLAALSAQAAAVTWVGGGATNTWQTAANWSSGAVPTISAGGDDVLIENAEVLYAEGVQHHAAGVQRHHHQQQHAKIQQQRILSDTFIIL